jgi:hypothetical protein
MLKPESEGEPGVQVRDTEWLAGAMPEPEREMEVGELGALLVTTAEPEELPAMVGAKTTMK